MFQSYRLLQAYKRRITKKSKQKFSEQKKCDGTLKNQQNKIRMTQQYFHTTPKTLCIFANLWSDIQDWCLLTFLCSLTLTQSLTPTQLPNDALRQTWTGRQWGG